METKNILFNKIKQKNQYYETEIVSSFKNIYIAMLRYAKTMVNNSIEYTGILSGLFLIGIVF